MADDQPRVHEFHSIVKCSREIDMLRCMCEEAADASTIVHITACKHLIIQRAVEETFSSTQIKRVHASRAIAISTITSIL